MQTRFDALIIGAGPAGASAAILLAKAGWSVGLVEKQAFPRRKVCGECVSASNLPLLDALGVGGAFETLAGPHLQQVAFMRGTHTVTADLPVSAHPQHAWGRALGRETLDTLLLDRAREAGAVVMQPWTVQKISGERGNHNWTVRQAATDRLTVLQAPVAILAHGSWEALPEERSVQRIARSGHDLLAFKANFQHTSLAAGLLPVLAFDGGYGGMVLADQGIVTLACCIRVDRLAALRRSAPGKSAGDVIEAMLQRECYGVAQALQGARRCGNWLASGPLAPGIRIKSDDQVFRIGNAAGEAHPIIGEGISMALQSAWLLSAALIAAGRQHSATSGSAWQVDLQRKYTTQWRHHFLPRLRLAATFAHLAMRPTTSAALLTLLRHWPALLTSGAAWGGKTTSAADISQGRPLRTT